MENKLSEGELLDDALFKEFIPIIASGYEQYKFNDSDVLLRVRLEMFAKRIQSKPTVTLAEIRELSARLRDTSRQSLYETKLKRWLESKGFVVVE